MKPLKADFEKLMSNEDVLCVKTVVNRNFETQFAENCIYSAISVNLEKKGSMMIIKELELWSLDTVKLDVILSNRE